MCYIPSSKERVYGHSFAGVVGSNPVEEMEVSCEGCVFSGRRLWEGPIPRPEE